VWIARTGIFACEGDMMGTTRGEKLFGAMEVKDAG